MRRRKDTLLAKGAWQHAARILDLCNTHVSHKWLFHLDTFSERVLALHDVVVNVQAIGATQADVVGVKQSWARSWNSEKLRYCGSHTCHNGTAGLTETTSRPADVFTTAAVLGRGAALDVCVASSNAAAARGDAAQAAFDRKTSHSRRTLHVLRVQGVVYRPLVWTANGRPHPAVTRTVQYAPDIVACRNGHKMSAKAFQHGWTNEVPIALLRRRAAMTRAVLPNVSARDQWLLSGLVDNLS